MRNPRKAWEIQGKYGKETPDKSWEIPGHFSSFDLKSPKIEIIAIRKMFLKALLKILQKLRARRELDVRIIFRIAIISIFAILGKN